MMPFNRLNPYCKMHGTKSDVFYVNNNHLKWFDKNRDLTPANMLKGFNDKFKTDRNIQFIYNSRALYL